MSVFSGIDEVMSYVEVMRLGSFCGVGSCSGWGGRGAERV